MSAIYEDLGKYDEAIKYALQAAQIREASLGRTHQKTRMCYDVVEDLKRIQAQK